LAWLQDHKQLSLMLNISNLAARTRQSLTSDHHKDLTENWG